MFSVLLRPAAVPQPRRGWAPLLAGVAVASGVNGLTGLDVGLKWPNDVLVGGAKLAGILAEQSADAIVVGIGINVSTQRDELPVETATSLALEGAAGTSRAELFGAVLGEFERLYQAWTHSAEPGDADAAGLRSEYRDRSVTLGSQVRVEFPGGAVAGGTALDVGPDGQLLVDTPDGPLAVTAGDVMHLR
jgi:BirA family biotin operon repressor/biotin-[acetyl-CoA-carboxylase] ligase